MSYGIRTQDFYARRRVTRTEVAQEAVEREEASHDMGYGEYTDTDRREFLNALDADPMEVTTWEAEFIESTLTRREFTPRQRESIDKMIEKYEGKIKW